MILEMYIHNTMNNSFPASSNHFLKTVFLCASLHHTLFHHFMLSISSSYIHLDINTHKNRFTVQTNIQNLKTWKHAYILHYSTQHNTAVQYTTHKYIQHPATHEYNYTKIKFAVQQKHEKTEKHAYILQYSTHHYTTVHYTTHNYIQHSATNKTVT